MTTLNNIIIKNLFIRGGRVVTTPISSRAGRNYVYELERLLEDGVIEWSGTTNRSEQIGDHFVFARGFNILLDTFSANPVVCDIYRIVGFRLPGTGREHWSPEHHQARVLILTPVATGEWPHLMQHIYGGETKNFERRGEVFTPICNSTVCRTVR